MKRTVLRMLDDAAKKYANSPYLSQKGENGWYAKTFKESNQESDYLAIGLMRLGINKSDKIAILAEGRIYWVTTEYAILKAGAVSVPLSIKLVPEEILFRINHSDSKAIVLSRNSFEKAAPIWSQIKADGFKVRHATCRRTNPLPKRTSQATGFGRTNKRRRYGYNFLHVRYYGQSKRHHAHTIKLFCE